MSLAKIEGALADNQLLTLLEQEKNFWVRAVVIAFLISRKNEQARSLFGEQLTKTEEVTEENKEEGNKQLSFTEDFWSEKQAPKLFEPLIELVIGDNQEAKNEIEQAFNTRLNEKIHEPFVDVLIEDTLMILEKIAPSKDTLTKKLFLFPGIAQKMLRKLFVEERIIASAVIEKEGKFFWKEE